MNDIDGLKRKMMEENIMVKPSDRKRIRPVQRAGYTRCRILETVVKYKKPITIEKICFELGITFSTALQHTWCLDEAGYIKRIQGEDGIIRFGLGKETLKALKMKPKEPEKPIEMMKCPMCPTRLDKKYMDAHFKDKHPEILSRPVQFKGGDGLWKM